MKKLTTIILFLIAINCYSQITTVTTKEKEEPIEVQKYDSLESLNYDNALLHVGQTLFIKGYSESKENGFYNFFSSKLDNNISDENAYVYKPTPGKKKEEIVTNYSEVVGNYYKVLSVEVGDKEGLYKTTYWLQLVGDDNTPFYYYMRFGLNGFVTLGYYEKMKQTFLDKEFYFKGRYKLNKVDTAETVIPPFKTKFKCTDIAVNVGEDGPIFAVLENPKIGRVKGEIIKGQKLKNFITISYYNECVKKYGTKFGSYVAEGKIEMGMNKKMVQDAWGSPDHVNVTQGSSGTHEQWVYDDRYLYFKNGILTSRQY